MKATQITLKVLDLILVKVLFLVLYLTDNLNISIEDNYNVICTSIEVNIDVIIVISI